MTPDLNSAEMAAIAAALKDAIDRNPFPLSPRIRQSADNPGQARPGTAAAGSLSRSEAERRAELLYRKLRGGKRRR
jgi:hypothetical protein